MNRKVLPIIATLIVLIGIIASQAQAQPKRKVTLEASVPFEFVVGNRAYPGGRYTFERQQSYHRGFTGGYAAGRRSAAG